MKRYDIIISGGGMIGSIAAVAAVNAGFSVLLIESNKNKSINEDTPRDLRVSAISWNNISYIKSLGIFSNLIKTRIQKYTKMQVWDNRSSGEIEFEADYSQQKCLGYLMENNNLVQAGWKTLEQYDNCDALEQSQIKNIENSKNQVRVQLKDGSQFKSKLLIAAEGRNSSVRQIANIKTKEFPYNQKGLVAYITIENAPVESALQAFNRGGPIGILPFNNGVFSIVWSLPEEECDQWLECTDVKFEQALKTVIAKDFGSIKVISQRAAFPLTQLYAEKYFENRIVLCGDSAHGIHPLAGQGVNLGIGDIQLLMKVMDKATIKDEDLLKIALRKYQRKRISKVTETSEMMSFLHYLFKNDNHIKKPLRNFALNFIDKTPIKKWFVNQAGS